MYVCINCIFIVVIYISFFYREFTNPHPQEHTIRESVGNFTLVIDKSLRLECFKKTILSRTF